MIAIKASVILALIAVSTSFEVSKIGVKNIVIGGVYYFTDTSTAMRNRDQALAYCASFGAELAKLTTAAQFRIIQMSFPVAGRYWIDGKDKEGADRFALNETCSPATAFDYSGLAPSNLFLANSPNCLSFVKGTNLATSRIETVPCTTTGRVLCAYPLDGCTPPTTTTTVSP